MNAQFHEEFVTLVAVFYSGELSEEDWALLQVHLAYCDSCRQVFEEYEQIHSHAIPLMAAAAANDMSGIPEQSDHSFAAAEERLMRHVDERSAPQIKPVTPLPWRRLLLGALAACFMCCLIYASLRFLHGPRPKPPVATPQTPSTLPALTPTPQVPKSDVNDLKTQDDIKIAALECELSAAQKKSAQATTAMSEIQRQLQAERAQQQQLVTQQKTLSDQLIAAQAASDSLKDKLATAEGGANQQTAVLEAKVRQLNASLEDANTALENKEKMLALDKDFLSHDRDIRDLIGARNLYIADIFDTNTNGTVAKPFGRIFYTQDRSLVFYGFDLDKQAGLKQSASFQVWGSGSDQKPVSLGLFYQDDTHKRWVLRSNDATTLAHTNMVFVTVEPPGGSSKPTGKQLLRAYLQIQPNHP